MNIDQMENYQMASLDVQNINYISFGVPYIQNIDNQRVVEQQNEYNDFGGCFNNISNVSIYLCYAYIK